MKEQYDRELLPGALGQFIYSPVFHTPKRVAAVKFVCDVFEIGLKAGMDYVSPVVPDLFTGEVNRPKPLPLYDYIELRSISHQLSFIIQSRESSCYDMEDERAIQVVDELKTLHDKIEKLISK